MLKRMDVMAPPKSAPQYRLVRRMMAEVGAMEKVRGRRMATPFAPPSPGSTPMIVPRVTPITASPRLYGWSATWNPRRRFSKPISVPEPGFDRTLGHGHEEPHLEDEEDADREDHADAHRGEPRIVAESPHVKAHVERGGEVETEPVHQEDAGHGGPQHVEHRT